MDFIFLIHKTPLDIAILNDNIKIVELLLKQNGIDKNIRNEILFIFFIWLLFEKLNDFNIDAFGKGQLILLKIWR